MKGFYVLSAAVCAAIGIGVIVVAVNENLAQPQTSISLDGRPQVGILHLAQGSSTSHFTVTAISPPTHTYEVLVQTSPSAALAVHIHTWYGTTLGVQYATHGTLASNCEVKRSQLDCLSHFPELGAERSGPWSVFASKKSGPPVAVRIAVTFVRASDGDE